MKELKFTLAEKYLIARCLVYIIHKAGVSEMEIKSVSFISFVSNLVAKIGKSLADEEEKSQ